MTKKQTEQKHYDLARVARAKAMQLWGSKKKDLPEAMRDLKGDDAIEGAVLELVRRLNQAIDAWSEDDGVYDSSYDPDKRPDNAITFPDAKVGDVLYYCDDLDYPPSAAVVVAIQDGYIRTVYADDFPVAGSVNLRWVFAWTHRTAAEAAKAQAEIDVAYHDAKLKRAKAVLDAIARDEPFEHFMKDVGDEVEDDHEL